ncbi:uncharacterized protein RSE6_13619 [Rhynchosporium secalis]|uniref:Uncharacterized protein n=1 Tax=Rhynchosporium secalis TaxID=38038 RepID=A0A1E1MTA1_RHYSE|nr:uncharacterized protein RSE6_13619 [Rhynchosporium secalis]
MPYERQLETIWARLSSPATPTPRHAISTRLAFDDVVAAFMQAELGPDLAGAWGISRWGHPGRGEARGRAGGRGRGRGGRGRGRGARGRGERGGRGGEQDLEDVMSEQEVFRAERNVWCYYYGENDPFPGIEPSVQPGSYTQTMHYTDHRYRRDKTDHPDYSVRSPDNLHGDISPDLRSSARDRDIYIDSRRTDSYVPNYAFQNSKPYGEDRGANLGLSAIVRDGERFIKGGEKAKLAIEERASEAEKFIREQSERRRVRRERKIKAGWVASDVEDAEREHEGNGHGDGCLEHDRKRQEAREWRTSQDQDRGAYAESLAGYGSAAHGYKTAVEEYSGMQGEAHHHLRGLDRRESHDGQRAGSYGHAEPKCQSPVDMYGRTEESKDIGSARKTRRGRRYMRKTDGEFAEEIKSLKDQARGRSLSPGREGGVRQWRGDKSGARMGQEYRERDYEISGRENYDRREAAGLTDRTDDLGRDHDVLSGGHPWDDDAETYIRFDGDQHPSDKHYDNAQDTGFESRRTNKRGRSSGAQEHENRQPTSLRRQDARRFLADTARTSDWAEEGQEQVQEGFQEAVYEKELPRYPRHRKLEEPELRGGRDRGFGVLKDSGKYFKEDRRRRR